MKDVLKVVGNILLYMFAIVVILWTASLTLSLVSRLLPGDDITPYFALALFDGGALVWLIVFIAKAQGLMQRAIALIMTMLDLLGVGFMSFAELYLGGQTFAEVPPELGKLVIWGVGIYTMLNVLAVYAFHITDPTVSAEIEIQTEQDKIEAEAMEQARARLQASSIRLGNRLADRLERQALYNLRLTDSSEPGPAPVPYDVSGMHAPDPVDSPLVTPTPVGGDNTQKKRRKHRITSARLSGGRLTWTSLPERFMKRNTGDAQQQDDQPNPTPPAAK